MTFGSGVGAMVTAQWSIFFAVKCWVLNFTVVHHWSQLYWVGAIWGVLEADLVGSEPLRECDTALLLEFVLDTRDWTWAW